MSDPWDGIPQKAELNPRPKCDHICLKDEGHVERGEPHFYGYELPSPRRPRPVEEPSDEILSEAEIVAFRDQYFNGDEWDDSGIAIRVCDEVLALRAALMVSQEETARLAAALDQFDGNAAVVAWGDLEPIGALREDAGGRLHRVDWECDRLGCTPAAVYRLRENR